DAVELCAVGLEPIDAHSRHRVGRDLVKTDGDIEVLGHRPERLVHRVADHLLAVIRVGPQEPAAHPELFAGERISSTASSIDCTGSIATPKRRSGYGLQ